MTPAIKYLKKSKIKFQIHSYSHVPSTQNYGEEAAKNLNIPPEQVFKTLVVQASAQNLAVGLVPVSGQLDLKAFSRFAGTKKAKMADKNLVERTTGYLLGGVSPVAQKKKLPTIIDSSALKFKTIFVSAGRRGIQVELSPKDLAGQTQAAFADIAACF